MWTRIAGFLTTLFLANPAMATGGFTCVIDDDNLQFEASSATGRGMGSPFLNLKAHAKPKLKGTPNDLSELDLKANLVHSWMDHPELRLHFYLEREGETPHGTFELVIATIATGDEISYEGEYRLTIFYTEPPANTVEGAYLKANGTVRCDVE